MTHRETNRQLDLMVRRERGRLIAGLVSRLSGHRLDVAEDVAQEALLAALATWPYRGIPDNPAGWLTKVAWNKAIDRLRNEHRTQLLDAQIPLADETVMIEPTTIGDPELQLMFLSSHPALTEADRLALTLRVVSGFTAREIAHLLLSSEDAIAQRLSRSKKKLKGLDGARLEPPSAFEVRERLSTVLKVVYLMFNVGYAPRSGSKLMRRDVANEALRLAEELARDKLTGTPSACALAALLCFQVSRLDAREDERGHPVLLKDQRRSCWDAQRVDEGMAYLVQARSGNEVSRFHLEAGIAAVYAAAPSWEATDWPTILRHYRRLEPLADSPVVSISASVALAYSGCAGDALARLDRLGVSVALERYAPFHIARAEVLRLLNRDLEARNSYQAAIACDASTPVIEHLESRLDANRDLKPTARATLSTTSTRRTMANTVDGV